MKDIKVLGISPLKGDLKSVRNQLWEMGGFSQARSTLDQKNVDKFFTKSTLRDRYYIEFRYTSEGKIIKIKQLYRPESILQANKRDWIQTRDVAQKMIQNLGTPTKIIRKGWGGMPSYLSYIWKDDEMTVIIDREGSEILGNVFVEYIVNKIDPYYVKPKPTNNTAQ